MSTKILLSPNKDKHVLPFIISWLFVIILMVVNVVVELGKLSLLGYLYCFSMLITTLLLPLHNRLFSTLTSTIYTIGLFIPDIEIPIMFPCVWLSSAMIGLLDKPSLIIIKQSVLCTATLLSTLSSYSTISIGSNITISCTFIIASTIGYQLQQNKRMHELRLKEQKAVDLQARQRIASSLHDSLSAHLSYIAIQAQLHTVNNDKTQQTNEEKQVWRDIYKQACTSLDIMHDIVDTLNNESSPSSLHFSQALNEIVSQNERIIRQLGINGTTMITAIEEPDYFSFGCIESLSLLSELYANVIRHCTKNSFYLMTIQYDKKKITLTQIDDGNNEQTIINVKKYGFGLSSHKARIEKIHGTIDYSLDNDQWNLHAVIPFTN